MAPGKGVAGEVERSERAVGAEALAEGLQSFVRHAVVGQREGLEALVELQTNPKMTLFGSGGG